MTPTAEAAPTTIPPHVLAEFARAPGTVYLDTCARGLLPRSARDAVVAHLYGLDEAQLVHVFETFHEGWDYEEPLRATLDHFLAWKGSG